MTQARHLLVPPTGLDPGTLAEVADHLRAGGLLAYPTGTVYGIGAVLREEPLERLARLKSRPRGKPFLVLLPSGELPAWVRGSPLFERLAAEFWPGPLTIVLPPTGPGLTDHVVGPEGGVAVRYDPHPLIQALLEFLGEPITSSSLNVPGTPPATTGPEALQAVEQLGAGPELWLLDAGPTPSSVSSTILDLSGHPPRILRVGAVPEERLAPLVPGLGEGVVASGSSHQPSAGDPPGFRILFVCTGNTCRSPLAEVIARNALRERGWSGVSVGSAGVFASEGSPASEGALEAARRAGLDLSGHRSRLVTPELVEAAGLVLTMTRGHRDLLEQVGLGGRASTLAAFASDDEPDVQQDVPDPFGGSQETYDRTFVELLHLVGRALDRLEPALSR